MNERPESCELEETKQCSWCEDGRGVLGHRGNVVCEKCHTLLTNAGVSDAEIYGLLPGKESEPDESAALAKKSGSTT